MKFEKEIFKLEYIKKLENQTARDFNDTTVWDKYFALGTYLKDVIVEDWINNYEKQITNETKQVYYFSLEFLTGRFLINNLVNIGIYDQVKEAMEELGLDLVEISEIEKDPGLGNGGLGRLAACFLDSLASIGYVGNGCGIRYNYGLFEQKIINGYQVEFPDRWLSNRNVWEIRREDRKVDVHFRGHIETYMEGDDLKFRHVNYDVVSAVPYDTPIIGYQNKVINNLRLFSSESVQNEFDFSKFSSGGYHEAFEKKHEAEAITQVLYPNDNYYEGRILRLKQEYFLVSAGIQSILRSYKKTNRRMSDVAKYVSIHINDTHPALIIPEFMRILLDEEEMPWNLVWEITGKVMSYTNHTILSEALEKWPIDLMKDLLPRVFMIIEEIDRRFKIELDQKFKIFDQKKRDKLEIIRDGQVRMANLCIVSSHSVNGVAKLHTEILKYKELNCFYNIYPYKFNNKTNGITHRRWLLNCNQELTGIIDEAIGETWKKDPVLLENLLKFKEDKGFLDQLDSVKTNNKINLARYIKEKNNIIVNPNSIFDIQAKRLHEYKRQVLNVFHIMHLYNSILENPGLDVTPRTFIFGAKAAPGYYIAKQTIKLINSLGDVINNDKRIQDKIKVVFLENYGVSLAEKIIPAADLSEQISTASKEASGTGNMKFMMNGAVTIGTLDGANVEIMDAVGNDNIYVFGLNSKEVYETYEKRNYNAFSYYENDSRIKKIIDQLSDGSLKVNADEFKSIRESILNYNDEFLILKDFDSYIEVQEKAGKDYMDKYKWLQKSLTNIAKSGIFSSDYTVKEYAMNIWNLGDELID